MNTFGTLTCMKNPERERMQTFCTKSRGPFGVYHIMAPRVVSIIQTNMQTVQKPFGVCQHIHKARSEPAMKKNESRNEENEEAIDNA